MQTKRMATGRSRKQGNTKDRQCDNEAAKLAVEIALAWQERHAQQFSLVPINLNALAEEVGISVERNSGRARGAYLVRSKTDSRTQYTMVLPPEMCTEKRRIAMAHEIGHFAFERLESRPKWEPKAIEHFADIFAEEILVPATYASCSIRKYLQQADPTELIRASRRIYGVSVFMLLNVVKRRPAIMEQCNSVWLLARYQANRVTGLDPRLRIIQAVFDRNRVYVPTNKSVAALLGDLSWLASCSFGRTVMREGASIEVWAKTGHEKPKYKQVRVSATLRVTKLRPAAGTGTPFFVFSVSILLPSRL